MSDSDDDMSVDEELASGPVVSKKKGKSKARAKKRAAEPPSTLWGFAVVKVFKPHYRHNVFDTLSSNLLTTRKELKLDNIKLIILYEMDEWPAWGPMLHSASNTLWTTRLVNDYPVSALAKLIRDTVWTGSKDDRFMIFADVPADNRGISLKKQFFLLREKRRTVINIGSSTAPAEVHDFATAGLYQALSLLVTLPPPPPPPPPEPPFPAQQQSPFFHGIIRPLTDARLPYVDGFIDFTKTKTHHPKLVPPLVQLLCIMGQTAGGNIIFPEDVKYIFANAQNEEGQLMFRPEQLMLFGYHEGLFRRTCAEELMGYIATTRIYPHLPSVIRERGRDGLKDLLQSGGLLPPEPPVTWPPTARTNTNDAARSDDAEDASYPTDSELIPEGSDEGEEEGGNVSLGVEVAGDDVGMSSVVEGGRVVSGIGRKRKTRTSDEAATARTA